MLKVYLSLILTLLLVGCGFQLRGNNQLPDEIKNISIEMSQHNNHFRHLLERRLYSSGIDVYGTADAYPKLVILSFRQSTFPIGYGRDGQVHRTRITLYVQFKVLSKKGEDGTRNVIVQPQVVTSSRDHTINPNDRLSNDDEHQIIVEEMENHIVQQIIHRIEHQVMS